MHISSGMLLQVSTGFCVAFNLFATVCPASESPAIHLESSSIEQRRHAMAHGHRPAASTGAVTFHQPKVQKAKLWKKRRNATDRNPE